MFWTRRLASPSPRPEDAELRRLGAVPMAAAAAVAPGGAECARAALRFASLRGVALVGVAGQFRVGRDGATVRLVADDESVLDHIYCVPRERPYDLALFAPPAHGITLRLGHITPDSDASILHARSFTFTAAALAPERLMPRGDLDRPSSWPNDPYGAPNIEDAPGRLRDLVFRHLSKPAAVPWMDGLRLMLEPDDEQSHCLMKSGLYEPEGLVAVRAHLAPGGVFVDVGANCGIYTLFAAQRVGRSGRVIALEPSAREFARLAQNVALNRFRHVVTQRAAVTESSGTAGLLVAAHRFGGHNTLGAQFAYDQVAATGVEPVVTVTLDDVLVGQPRCDMIKLDIEGAELRALTGARSVLERLRPVLLLEVYEAALHANGARVADLLGYLAARGYELRDIGPEGRAAGAATFPPGVNTNVLALPIGA